jgi:2-oxoglutarate dehydrogenase E2 component (dihydrolipoamide succinyltransferase)
MAEKVKIPEVGESITEGFLAEWLQPDGTVVAVEDPLLVLETDKITMNVTAEHAGKLAIMVAEGETVEVGQVVASIDTSVTASAVAAPQPTAAPEPEPEPEPVVEAEPTKTPAAPHPGLSPAVQRLVLEHELDPAAIQGTGKGGRILKGDVIRFLESGPATAAAPELAAAAPTPEPERPRPKPVALPDQRQARAPMSRLRQRLAERLVEVQQTAAILTTFNEADMSGVMELRSRYKEEFKAKHGIGLGFMSFFVKATVDALKTVPEVNAYIDGDASL